jgi:hypothetical protein
MAEIYYVRCGGCLWLCETIGVQEEFIELVNMFKVGWWAEELAKEWVEEMWKGKVVLVARVAKKE